jgi:transposase
LPERVGSIHKAGSNEDARGYHAHRGIDTGKEALDVAVHGKPSRFTVDNRPVGWHSLAAALVKAGVQRVGIEATGGYERSVTRHLQAEGFTVVVLQPLQVRAFAKLHLQRAKSDRIDATLIAACTHVLDAQSRRAPIRAWTR